MIAILYYLHDIPKYKHIKTKLNFCAHEMVNILQNASQNRDAAHKKITVSDIQNALAGAYMSIFPGKTMYTTSAHTLPRGQGPFAVLHCVRGLGGGKASVLWQRAVYTVDYSDSPSIIVVVNGHWSGRILVAASASADMSAIYPDLKIQNGEIKIIVECTIMGGYNFTDGRLGDDVSPREAFGLLILTPKNRRGCYFNTVAIFTPNPGLFDKTAPT
ncbi:MAG: hypothetical protein LBJ71_04765 [Holosporaceae bacterium]|nr:hypothetical protein [Holosporaceae bacterium]